MQKEFANKVVEIIKTDSDVIGLAGGGSFISNELDEYSDLDLILITGRKMSGDRQRMLDYAHQFGDLISGFTGEHVGEPRVLICLYDHPLLHVDIKFLTLPEFYDRVENPVILFERDNQLTNIIDTTKAEWPQPGYQWIEDRFWTWVHYIASKAARGEYFECLDGLGFLRVRVLGPLLQIKNKLTPRGLRKVETAVRSTDLEKLKRTLASHHRRSIFNALDNSVTLYRSLRKKLYPIEVHRQNKAEQKCLAYLEKVK